MTHANTLNDERTNRSPSQLAASLAPLIALVDFVVAIPATEEEAAEVRAAVSTATTTATGNDDDEIDDDERTTAIPRVRFLEFDSSTTNTLDGDGDGDGSDGSSSSSSSVLIEFHVHRLALAAHSPFLHRMLTSGMREANTGRLELPPGDFSPLAVASMLHFFYARGFPEGAPVTELLVLCERYRAVEALRAIASVALDECAAVDNVLCLLELAPLLGASLTSLPPTTKKTRRGGGIRGGGGRAAAGVRGRDTEPLARLFAGCLDMAAKNILTAADDDPESFARLPAAAMCALLSHDALVAADEDEVLALALRWAGWDNHLLTSSSSSSATHGGGGAEGRRRKSLTDVEEVLPHVRFPQLTCAFLTALEEEEGEEEERRGGASALYAVSKVLQSLVAEARLVQRQTTAATAGTRELPGTMAVASDRSSVSLAPTDRLAAARREPRRCFGANLVYLRDGDTNGVCSFIGSKCGTSQWTNPVRSGDIIVAASSPVSRFTDPEVVVSGEFAHTSFAGPVIVPCGGGGGGGGAEDDAGAGGWWRVDLGEGRRLRCNYYTARQDGSLNFPRHWELQGKSGEAEDDEEGVDGEEGWVTLRKHEGDATLCGPGQWGAWPVPAPASHVPVRYLRLKLTGQTTGGGGATAGEGWRLCLSSFEFYGLLTTTSKTATKAKAHRSGGDDGARNVAGGGGG